MRDESGNTAMHLACQKHETPETIAIALLRRGADQFATNDAKQTAFEVAVLNQQNRIAFLLASHMPKDKINADLPCGKSPFLIAQVLKPSWKTATT